ncbi:MAG: DUF1800 domain-containing protein [Fimbriimonas sp.]
MKTQEEKIRHLFRRYGLGASPAEIELGMKLGIEGSLKHLIEYEQVDEQFPVHPFEFCWRDKSEADPGAYNFRQWWVFRLLATKRPLQEKMTVFWHNHFAVSEGKVEDGPIMLYYLQTLRQHATGKFGDLLKAVSTTPALMRYLDLQRAYRGHPNENFAREVMELFTLGIGNYTEKDIQEASRALTGWSYVHLYYEFPGNNDVKLRESLKYERPFAAFAYLEAMRDPTEKTILGKKGDIDGYELLQMLAEHPITAKNISRKMWELLVYPDPAPQLVDRIAKVFLKSKGDIKAVLYAMAKQPEFWSEKAERAIVKSPVDFVIPICRQQGVGDALMALRDPKATPETRINQKIPDNLWGIQYRMEMSGMSLLYPPDVSGWDWGESWASPAAMVERMRFRGAMMYGDNAAGAGAQTALDYIKKSLPASSEAIGESLLRLFDVNLHEDQKAVLTALIERSGGLKVLDDPRGWVNVMDRAMTVLVAAPEAHMC